MDFKTHHKASQTFHNTPNCWGIYMAGLNYSHMLEEGIENIAKRSTEKAQILYDFIDGSEGYYSNPVEKRYRSQMNVPFRVKCDKELEAKFKKEAEKAGFMELAGHRSVGGCRASIYNGMPNDGVRALVGFMKKFQTENPQTAKL
jgi:phosphoserine aminotransferase